MFFFQEIIERNFEIEFWMKIRKENDIRTTLRLYISETIILNDDHHNICLFIDIVSISFSIISNIQTDSQ